MSLVYPESSTEEKKQRWWKSSQASFIPLLIIAIGISYRWVSPKLYTTSVHPSIRTKTFHFYYLKKKQWKAWSLSSTTKPQGRTSNISTPFLAFYDIFRFCAVFTPFWKTKKRSNWQIHPIEPWWEENSWSIRIHPYKFSLSGAFLSLQSLMMYCYIYM